MYKRYLMKQATILLSFTFLLPSVHLSVKNVHLLLPTSAERGQMMNWRLGETFNLLLNWILLMYFWKNNRAQEFWAFSAPAPEPNFDPAGMTAPTPSPVHNFLIVFMPWVPDCKDFNLQGNKNIQMRYVLAAIIKRWPLLNCHGIGSTLFWLINHYNVYTSIGRRCTYLLQS